MRLTRIIAVLAAVALTASACKTIDKQQTCDSAAAALAAYQAYMLAGQEPPKDQIAAAAAATAFLSTYCGWRPNAELHGLKDARSVVLDGNGIPLLIPPREAQ